MVLAFFWICQPLYRVPAYSIVSLKRGTAYSSWFNQFSHALNSKGRPRKSLTSDAAGFDPPGASTAFRYLAATPGARRSPASNWLNMSFAMTSDHIYV